MEGRGPCSWDAAANLAEAALDAGSHHNVTCVVADVVAEPAVVGTGQVLAAADLRNVDPACGRALRSA